MLRVVEHRFVDDGDANVLVLLVGWAIQLCAYGWLGDCDCNSLIFESCVMWMRNYELWQTLTNENVLRFIYFH